MLIEIKKYKPEAEKFTHDQVGYEDPSTHPGQRCENCEHFIDPTSTSPAGCEGVQRPIAESAWCHRYEKDENMKHHKFHKTTAEHHKDGSITIEHHHEDGPEHNVRHAVSSLDHMHDSMQDHLGTPNPGEMEANAGPAAPPAAPAMPPQGA